jgi:hypothetical protein
VAAFADSGPRIETAYNVLDSDYATHMDIRQHTDFEIARYFAANGIHFTYSARRSIGSGMQEPQSNRKDSQSGPKR